MVEQQQFEVWKDDVMPALTSKVEEFHMLGYDRATEEELWECVLAKLRKEKKFVQINHLVSVILTLKVNDYMTWLTVGAYKAPNWFTSEEPPNW
ncbi:post-transcriptional regulator [Anaerobacillus sp. CMMVII]|uniref:post-transcriptional regulator n=1 Tax=Anaerobacillus sp. CMMVII TaxID=2755588 RepID=UPI0021B8130D|nr:post-transcriptional regulator [Anaerobacillus sp. CMMVII]MCT8139539.1 post-transcriptional regulator [Anaerobacillus sp. CMMVII]